MQTPDSLLADCDCAIEELLQGCDASVGDFVLELEVARQFVRAAQRSGGVEVTGRALRKCALLFGDPQAGLVNEICGMLGELGEA
jgi:hypothetical protein